MTAPFTLHPYLARVLVIGLTLAGLFVGLVAMALLCTAVQDWLRHRDE